MKILVGSSAEGYELLYDTRSGELVVRDSRVPGLAPVYFPIKPVLLALVRLKAVDFATLAILADPTPVEARQAVPPPPRLPRKDRTRGR